LICMPGIFQKLSQCFRGLDMKKRVQSAALGGSY